MLKSNSWEGYFIEAEWIQQKITLSNASVFCKSVFPLIQDFPAPELCRSPPFASQVFWQVVLLISCSHSRVGTAKSLLKLSIPQSNGSMWDPTLEVAEATILPFISTQQWETRCQHHLWFLNQPPRVLDKGRRVQVLNSIWLSRSFCFCLSLPLPQSSHGNMTVRTHTSSGRKAPSALTKCAWAPWPEEGNNSGHPSMVLKDS